MRIHTLRAEQYVARPIGEVFEFFSRPENLARITPPSLGFVILTPSPIEMKVGAEIEYTIGVAGIRVRWKTLITEYEPPNRFVDEQAKGPYAYWKHTHAFRPEGDGAIISDEVQYALPFGLIGAIAHRLYVRNEIKKIFAYRRTVIDKIFVDDDAQSR
jgi:ligand-binding SRPBCC domain-containing protein